MGWISDRHMKNGGSINSRPSRNGSQNGPLRKIVSIQRYCESIFDRDAVTFECGHEGYATSGAVRGRCRKCKASDNS